MTDSNKPIDEDVIAIKREIFEQTLHHKKWTIVETDNGWEVGCQTSDSVAPTTIYPTKRLAASRILQLLGIGPVAPQDHPEDICIGYIRRDSHD